MSYHVNCYGIGKSQNVKEIATAKNPQNHLGSTTEGFEPGDLLNQIPYSLGIQSLLVTLVDQLCQFWMGDKLAGEKWKLLSCFAMNARPGPIEIQH